MPHEKARTGYPVRAFFWVVNGNDQMRGPWINRTSSITKARTSRTWIKPPRVYDETRPRAQKITKMMAIFSSMA
jgi:hypothetical protein